MTIMPQHLVKRDGSVKSFDASKMKKRQKNSLGNG